MPHLALVSVGGFCPAGQPWNGAVERTDLEVGGDGGIGNTSICSNSEVLVGFHLG